MLGGLRRLGVVFAFSVIASATPVIGPLQSSPEPPPVRRISLPLTAAAMRPKIAFAMLGVVWPASREGPSSIEARVHRRGGWGPWTTLSLDEDEGPDAPSTIDSSEVAGTAPLWVGRATTAQFRVRGAVPEGLRAEFLDPGRPGIVAPPRPRSSALAIGRPGIVSRAEWGADESIRSCCPSAASELRAAFVHHTATGNGYSQGDAPRVVRSIYAYHVLSRGWSDIGYNFLVDRFGRVYEGRSGGIDRPIVGAHAQGFNTGSVGVSVIGTFDAAPPAAAMSSVADVLAWKLDLHHIDPSSETTMISGGGPKYAAGTAVFLPRINGHRDVGSTGCPGGGLHGALPSVRRDVARPQRGPRIYDPGAVAAEVTPNGDGVADAAEARARFSDELSWRASVVSPSGEVLFVASGSGRAASVSWDGRDHREPSAGSRARTGARAPAAPHGRYRIQIEAWNALEAARPAEVPVLVRAWPDGAVLLGAGAGWVLDDGVLRPFSGPRAFESRLAWHEAVTVHDSTIALWPKGRQTGFRDGSLVRSAGRVWLISAGARREVGSSAFRSLGFDERAVVDVQAFELAPHPVGPPVDAVPIRPEGVVLRGSVLPHAWKLQATARAIVSAAVMDSHRIRDIDLVGPADVEIAASAGATALGFRDGTLLRARSGPAVYVVSDGLRRPVSSAERFEALGYSWGSVRDVSDAELALHQSGPPL